MLIKNKETDEVISKVTVSVVKYNQNYFSNEEGIVKFELVKPSKITLSHPDFKDVVLQSTQIKETPFVVYLQPFSRDRRGNYYQ